MCRGSFDAEREERQGGGEREGREEKEESAGEGEDGGGSDEGKAVGVEVSEEEGRVGEDMLVLLSECGREE